MYILIASQYLQIERAVNRVRFVEEMLCESMNVFIYYKTLTIHLGNIVAIIFQKKLSLFLVRAVASVCSCHDRKQSILHTKLTGKQDPMPISRYFFQTAGNFINYCRMLAAQVAQSWQQFIARNLSYSRHCVFQKQAFDTL